jgi:signal transduction histidine kinase
LAERSLSRRGAGALLVGTGICAMHCIGMAALHFSGAVMWDPWWVLFSFLIAVTASWAAMEMLARGGDGMKNLTPRVMASAVIAVAICGMHYAGMHAFMPAPGAVSLHLPASFSGMTLARIGVGNAMLFTFALLVVSYRDKALWIQKASAARMENEEAARKLEALATAGKIAASVAHEINNPLEAVTNLLFLAQMGQVGESERQYLALAQKELERIASITTHTLRFYRQQSSPASVSIPELLESALVLFQTPLTAQKIVLERVWAEGLPQVVCREGEIRQVVANLISNAIDAMPEGGRLRLEVKPLPEGIEIEVTDTGPGIPNEVQGRILEPFFTTKGRNGTGLGLSISAEILARHGGTLRFDSGSGTDGAVRGTRFRFFLPFAFVAEPAPVPAR